MEAGKSIAVDVFSTSTAAMLFFTTFFDQEHMNSECLRNDFETTAAFWTQLKQTKPEVVRL